MATELLFSELKTWLDAQPENTAGTPYEIIIKDAPRGGGRAYTNAITRFVNIVGMEMKAGVTSIEQEAFLNCLKLIRIVIPNGVTSINNQAFQGCENLEIVFIPTSTASIKFGAFSGCHGLKYISMPYGITSIGNFVFSNCYNLKSLDLPMTLTSIGAKAFSYCTSLSVVYTYAPFSESLMQSDSFTGTPSNLRLLVYSTALSGWQSATLTNYGFASGARVEPLYTKWVRGA